MLHSEPNHSALRADVTLHAEMMPFKREDELAACMEIDWDHGPMLTVSVHR
jgi:hypothetical protein